MDCLQPLPIHAFYVPSYVLQYIYRGLKIAHMLDIKKPLYSLCMNKLKEMSFCSLQVSDVIEFGALD